MSEEYLRRISIAIDNVKRIIDAYSDEYHVIIMADHGGHDRTHGHNIPEDMTIPVVVRFKGEKADLDLSNASILDIAPTVTTLLGVAPDEEWEGKSLVK